jgi:pilus assembly protein CpaE
MRAYFGVPRTALTTGSIQQQYFQADSWYQGAILRNAVTIQTPCMFREFARSSAVIVQSPASEPGTASAIPESPAGSLLSFAIAGSDPAACSNLRHMLLQTGFAKEIHEWASAKAVELRHSQDVPDVVFLDLNGTPESDFAFAQQLAKLRPSVHIVACSAKRESNPEFLLQAMRSGVRDFLQKPYDRIELCSLIDRVSGEHLRVMPRRSVTGKLFVVLGTKGGVGTSTVSVNLAVQLAKIPGKSTVLLDFSRPMGDVAGFLDLRPSFQLNDAVENFKRLDPTLLSGLLTQHKSGLKVLAGASRLQDWQHASASAIERLVEIAQQSFDFVVMDFGSFYSPDWQNVLQAAEILLVSEADLPGLAKLHRHLGALAHLQVSSSQVRLIINRWHRHDEPALEKVELGMKIPVFARLPNNFKQVSEANVRGDSLKQDGDPLSAEFHKMATRLAGQNLAKQTKKSRLGQFFSV